MTFLYYIHATTYYLMHVPQRNLHCSMIVSYILMMTWKLPDTGNSDLQAVPGDASQASVLLVPATVPRTKHSALQGISATSPWYQYCWYWHGTSTSTGNVMVLVFSDLSQCGTSTSTSKRKLLVLVNKHMFGLDC